jgi:tryptophanyl-tRNA synthetase
MSSSSESGKVDLLDDPETVTKKIRKVHWPTPSPPTSTARGGSARLHKQGTAFAFASKRDV